MSESPFYDQATRLYLQDGRSVFIVTSFSVSLLILSWAGIDLYFAPDVFYQLLAIRLTIAVQCLIGGFLIRYRPDLLLYERLLIGMSAYTQLAIGYMIVIVPATAVEKYLLGYVLCILGLGSILLWRIKSFAIFSALVLLGQTMIGIQASLPIGQLIYIIIVTLSSLVIAGIFVIVRSRVSINNFVQKLLVDERTERLNKIFTSVENAIAVIGLKNRRPVLDGWRSASFDRSFAHLKGREIPYEEFLAEFKLTEDQKVVHRNIVESLLGESIVNFELNVGNLATHVVKVGPEGSTLSYDVSYSPLNDQNEMVVGILMSMLDVSERLLSEERARENKMLADCMIDVIRIGYGKYIRAVQQLTELASKADQVLQRFLTTEDHLRRRMSDEYFAVLHTIKGNARALGFSSIANQAHATETILNEIRKDPVSSRESDEQLVKETKLLSLKLGIYQKIVEDIGGHESNLIIPKQGFKKAMSFNSWLDIRSAIERHDEDAHELREFLAHAFVSFSHTLSDIAQVLEKTSEQLGKPRPSLCLKGHDPWLTAEAAHDIKAAMIHMVNNALDHGIETPEERRNAGKAEAGTLTISARQTPAGAQIRIGDDGRGLALAQLRAILNQEGRDPHLSDIEVASSIFRSGLSTKQDVSDISGRGVGMAAVKDLVEKHDGRVSLALGERHGENYCAFEIIIDLPAPPIWS
jgi:signal transduction histidine kinase